MTTETVMTETTAATETTVETVDTAVAAVEETKPAETPAADSTSAIAEAKEPYKVDLPEGMQADEKVFGEFTALVNEHGVPKEKADALLSSLHASQQAQVQQVFDGWRKASETDQEFGGAQYAQNVGIAKQALNKFGGDALVEVLNETGMGNHPEIIRAFYHVGKAMGEGKVMTQVAEAPPAPQSLGEAIANLAKQRKGEA